MEIKIAGHTIKLYNQVNVNLKYDSIASTFSFKLFFDPTNTTHKEVFRPGANHQCTISHDGVLLITGVCLSVRFYSSGDPARQLVDISGYSITGVLEDCPSVAVPFENSGLSIKQIAAGVSSHYGIDVEVDPEVATECDTIIVKSIPYPDESIRVYLDKICSHVNVVLSHTPTGKLLLTKVKSDKILTTTTTLVNVNPVPRSNSMAGAPSFTAQSQTIQKSNRATICDLTPNNRHALWLNMETSFDGQRIHSDIVVMSQSNNSTGPNGAESEPLFNPYYDNSGVQDSNIYNSINNTGLTNSRGARPATIIQQTQTNNSDNKVEKTARSVMGDEIKGVTLSVSFDRWVVNGHMVTPNQMLTAQNSDVYLFKKTKWFIQEVSLYGDEKEETARIVCVPPDAFGTDPVTNIFK